MKELRPMEYNDIKRIEKLMTLTNPDTFWDDVRKFTRRITSDHSISHWQHYAELRYLMLTDPEAYENL